MAFIRDLCEQGGFSEEEAVRSAAVVLTRLEQRLTGEEARDLNEQLPVKLVEILAEARRPNEGKPVQKFHREEFLEVIGKGLDKSREEAESITRSVFATVRMHITEGEAHDVASQLPKDLQALWSRPI